MSTLITYTVTFERHATQTADVVVAAHNPDEAKVLAAEVIRKHPRLYNAAEWGKAFWYQTNWKGGRRF